MKKPFMNRGSAALLAGLLAVAATAWGQQDTAPAERTSTQLRTLRQQVAAMRKQLAEARHELESERAAHQDLQAQLSALKEQVARLNALQQRVDSLAGEVRAVRASSILDLNGYLAFQIENGYPTAVFRGINVQIVNGTGETQAVNGLGNLIVGYNRASEGNFVCSLGVAASEAECLAGGGVWARSHKNGSHNIVGGDFNNYSSWGGLVLGVENTLGAPYASVLNGARNRAGGNFSTITGGSYNTATGIYSSVSAGFDNHANGAFSGVSGGAQHTAPTSHDWAAGGLFQDQ